MPTPCVLRRASYASIAWIFLEAIAPHPAYSEPPRSSSCSSSGTQPRVEVRFIWGEVPSYPSRPLAYPREAEARCTSACVALDLPISAAGVPGTPDVQASQIDLGFVEAAVDSARSWKFNREPEYPYGSGDGRRTCLVLLYLHPGDPEAPEPLSQADDWCRLRKPAGTWLRR